MRDLQLQTPQRDQNSANRRLKTVSDPNRNLQKSLKEFSEASDDNSFAESAENSLASAHPAKTQSLESDAVSDLTSTLSSSSLTATPYKHVSIETAYTDKPEMDSIKMGGSVEAEVVIKHLREARVQVLKSKDIGPSKNVVEALINIIIEEFCGSVYEEDEWLDKLLSSKRNQVSLICIMVLFSLLMVWFLSSSSNGSLTGPTPT
ncbi:uncharacterized protein LOC131024258 isoform X2 [Salvia miltiorrhiza]|uniref:uncharacterized protein LOC131024258 isoform X2 n=1 Tax=Salvia miltiorrhiza TaxID=226208 RepID=UPI0025AC2D42|nr:uncharacterized protein LOC131024258 isoform X2 [Salvia miltiorrhiza]